MAKILTEMPKRLGGAGRKPIYPYDEWLDGQIRQLEPDIDYTAKPQSVVSSARATAEKRGMHLRTRYLHNSSREIVGIVIQAFTPDPDPSQIVETVTPETIKKSPRRPKSKQTA